LEISWLQIFLIGCSSNSHIFSITHAVDTLHVSDEAKPDFTSAKEIM